jgi:hypothetical protein
MLSSVMLVEGTFSLSLLLFSSEIPFPSEEESELLELEEEEELVLFLRCLSLEISTFS